MVANLQQVGVELFGEHLPLCGRLGISFQQHRGFSVDHMEHQRIVIAGCSARRVLGRRCKHFDLRATEAKAAARGHRFDRDVEPPGFGEESLIGWDLRIGAHPQHAGTKITQDGKHSSHVIAVRVGESDGIETADIARPKHRGNHVFADFKVGVGGLGRPSGGATGVDEQGFSLGGDQQQRVPLANVDSRNL